MSLPNRASDSGPQGKAECPACGARNWHTMADCEVCADTVCSRCASVETVGLVCAKCLPEYLESQNDADWEASRTPSIEALHLIQARVHFANIPEWEHWTEWNKGKVN